MTLADTSCWIEFFHPQGSAEVKRVLTSLIEADQAAICGPVICEILRGASPSEATRLRRVLGGLRYLPQSDVDWKSVGNAAVQLQKRGQQPPLMDLLIAAVASRHKVPLTHYGDRHFSLIQKVLQLEVHDLKAEPPKGARLSSQRASG